MLKVLEVPQGNTSAFLNDNFSAMPLILSKLEFCMLTQPSYVPISHFSRQFYNIS